MAGAAAGMAAMATAGAAAATATGAGAAASGESMLRRTRILKVPICVTHSRQGVGLVVWAASLVNQWLWAWPNTDWDTAQHGCSH